MDFSQNNNNYSGGSSRAIEMCQDSMSKSNYDNLCRAHPQLDEYFVRNIESFYNESNVYSETNQQQPIGNENFECELLSTTTHFNVDLRHTTHPMPDGKFFASLTFYIDPFAIHCPFYYI